MTHRWRPALLAGLFIGSAVLPLHPVPPPASDPGITFIGHGSVPGNAMDLSGLNGRSICPAPGPDETPEKYTDDYRENLMRIIKARMKGKAAHLVSEEPERDSNVVDLMERLRQSLASSKGAVKSRRASGASTRTRKRVTKRHAAA